jgi:TolA-binding protein
VFVLLFVAILLFVCGLASPVHADDRAPDREFERISEMVGKQAASEDVVNKLYQFMELYPRDPRSDQVQFWVAQVQQNRKYHNEAIKEYSYVVSDFPRSPLMTRALLQQAQSYIAIAKVDDAVACYQKIIDNPPADVKANAGVTGTYREALLWMAGRAEAQKPEPDIATAVDLVLRLPDRKEAVTRCVNLYIKFERFEDALQTIKRLPNEDRHLAYRLLADIYIAREGNKNLFDVLARVLSAEKEGGDTTATLQYIVNVIGRRGDATRAQALEIVVASYKPLQRWAAFDLCRLHRTADVERLRTFIGDFNTGGDVEQAKRWIGEFYEAASQPAQAREAYGRLDDTIAGHFLIAETYYGPRARTKDLPGGERELTEIAKRFYSQQTTSEALQRRAELQAGAMGNVDAGIETYRELINRFPEEGEYPAHAMLRIGQLLRTQKKYDDAIGWYERLIRQYPRSGHMRPAWMQIADTYEQMEDKRRARDTLLAVLKKFPHTREASAAHTRLERDYGVADANVAD